MCILSAFQSKRIKNLESQYKEQLDTIKKEFDAERYGTRDN